MPISRRDFLSLVASAAAAGAAANPFLARAAEGTAISWPSRVVQLPPDDEDHKPPVVTAVRMHREGLWLATAGDDHHVRVWSLTDGKLVHKLSGHTDWVRAIDYSPDGRLLASAGNDRRILLWEAATGTQLEVLATHQAAISSIRFSHDGTRLASVGFEEHVRLYDMTKLQLAARLPAPCQDMRTVTFSDDDQFLAVGGRCGTVRLYAMPNGELLRDLPAHRQRIRAIAFSSDGSYVASSGEDRLTHVAPLSGGPGYKLPLRPAKVLAIAFCGPQQLATAGSDNLIRLWDAATKEEIGLLRGHTGSVAALECKGKVLVSAGYDTTVRVWEVGDQVAGGKLDGPGRVGARPTETKVGR
jgi:dipeptidyl aminopeptidase/acylaminoacyl peptidase